MSVILVSGLLNDGASNYMEGVMRKSAQPMYSEVSELTLVAFRFNSGRAVSRHCSQLRCLMIVIRALERGTR